MRGHLNVAPVNQLLRLPTRVPGVELRLRFRVHDPDIQGLEAFLVTRKGIDTLAGPPDPTRETQVAFLSAFEERHPGRCATQLQKLRRQGHPITSLVLVHNTMVEPEYRGQGMGRILYRAVAEALAARGFAFGPHDCLWRGVTSAGARKAWTELCREYPSTTGAGERARPVVFGVSRSGSRALEPRMVDERQKGPFFVRDQYFAEGMSQIRFGKAKGIGRKAAQEFIMVLKSWTKDVTLSVDTARVEAFYRIHGIADAAPAAFIDLIKLGRDVPRRTGLGQAMFDRMLTEARARGVRVLLLVGKRFTGEASPTPFWIKNGFVLLEDGLALRPHDPKHSLGAGDITLMGRVL